MLRAMRDNRLLDLGQSANTPQNVGCASLILYAKAISVRHPGALYSAPSSCRLDGVCCATLAPSCGAQGRRYPPLRTAIAAWPT